jgi:hypothetical protein
MHLITRPSSPSLCMLADNRELGKLIQLERICVSRFLQAEMLAAMMLANSLVRLIPSERRAARYSETLSERPVGHAHDGSEGPRRRQTSRKKYRNCWRWDVDTGANASVTGREPISRKIANNTTRSRKRAGVPCTTLNARPRATTKTGSAPAWLLFRWQEERARYE